MKEGISVGRCGVRDMVVSGGWCCDGGGGFVDGEVLRQRKVYNLRNAMSTRFDVEEKVLCH